MRIAKLILFALCLSVLGSSLAACNSCNPCGQPNPCEQPNPCGC